MKYAVCLNFRNKKILRKNIMNKNIIDLKQIFFDKFK